MRLDRFIARSRIIDLQSTDFRGALKELLEVCDFSKEKGIQKGKLLDELMAREKQMTTYLGNGVSLPHARIPMKRSYMIAIGRCRFGLDYEGQKEYGQIRLVFLLLAAENSRSYLYSLASLARVFQDNALMKRMMVGGSLRQFRDEVKAAFSGEGTKPRQRHTRFNNLMLRETAKIARGANCSSILVFGDTFGGGIELGRYFEDFKTVLITHGGTETTEEKGIDAVLPIRSFSNSRFSQLRSAVLIGLTRDVFKTTERLCCVGGIPQSNQFDSVIVVDVEREFQTMMIQNSVKMLPTSVKPEVIERVLAIATELAVEGREGHPIGCIFVLGDADKINEHTKPLILNPFYGYSDEDRNILNPFMDETVKELSFIDGAFVIRGDGVLDSAGTLIHTPEYNHSLPSGLGSRHAAAAAISMAVDCLCIVVSGSTGQVSLFRKGEMLPIIEKALTRRI